MCQSACDVLCGKIFVYQLNPCVKQIKTRTYFIQLLDSRITTFILFLYILQNSIKIATESKINI